jgi:hypothetical protein
MRDIAALNQAVEEIEARLANHESRLPPEPKMDDPNHAYSHRLTYWVRPVNPPTPNMFSMGLIGSDGPHDAEGATERAQAVALERARYYEPTSREPWRVVCVGWRDYWQAVKDTGVVLIIEQLEANGRVVHDWNFANELPNYLSEKESIDE